MFPGNPGFSFWWEVEITKGGKEPYERFLECMYPPEQHTCELMEEQENVDPSHGLKTAEPHVLLVTRILKLSMVLQEPGARPCTRSAI